MCLNELMCPKVYDLSEEPVTGYRVFKLKGSRVLRLCPQIFWHGNNNGATGNGGVWWTDVAFSHKPPDTSTLGGAGLHCYNSLNGIRTNLGPPRDLTWGKVVGTDYGIKASNGWRLSHAFITEVYLPQVCYYWPMGWARDKFAPKEICTVRQLQRMTLNYPSTTFFRWTGKEYKWFGGAECV